MTLAGFPHSDICGSIFACNSPQLFAAYHVLLRRMVPWHPPCALCSLIFSSLDPETNWSCFFLLFQFSSLRSLTLMSRFIFQIRILQAFEKLKCVPRIPPVNPILRFQIRFRFTSVYAFQHSPQLLFFRSANWPFFNHSLCSCQDTVQGYEP